jgi:hypothetical protein
LLCGVPLGLLCGVRPLTDTWRHGQRGGTNVQRGERISDELALCGHAGSVDPFGVHPKSAAKLKRLLGQLLLHAIARKQHRHHRPQMRMHTRTRPHSFISSQNNGSRRGTDSWCVKQSANLCRKPRFEGKACVYGTLDSNSKHASHMYMGGSCERARAKFGRSCELA